MLTSILGDMSSDLLIPKSKLDYLIRSAPFRYKVYNIPKRSGRGTRIIAQPARETKLLQYWVLKNIFYDIPVHACATAYMSGTNIKKNAEVHSKNPYMLKLDFEDFFHSIKGGDFIRFLQKNDHLSILEEDKKRLLRILFWLPSKNGELQLSIGAPSSPLLSNAIMYQFDKLIYDYCSEKYVIYTRYADDMTFSMTDIKMRGVILKKVEAVLASLAFPTLRLNKRKTIFGSKAHRRIITGLILANDGSISLGRERKRIIRAQIYNLSRGTLTETEKKRLQGLIAFARDIEPAFIERMEKKYGQLLF